MTYKCTDERFRQATTNHSMEIIRDDDVYRHLRFSNNGSNVYRFDLITWPGNLCVTGDCGTYLFSRLYDMFQFFTGGSSTSGINPHYWGEKLESVSRNGGYKEFESDTFEKHVKEWFDEYEFDDDEQKSEEWERVETELLSKSEYETCSCDAVYNYDSEHGLDFTDFLELDCNEFTFHYIWNLRAIVFGIGMYRKAHNGLQPQVSELARLRNMERKVNHGCWDAYCAICDEVES